MSKRLQVIMDEAELERYRRRANRQGLSLSEWVRRALRQVSREEPTVSGEERLNALERALECEHPTADVDEILKDIERGRDLR